MQGVRLDDVDFPAKEILKVHLESAEIDQRGAGAELHEEIDIAAGVGFAAREGAEDLQAACAVVGHQSEDLLAFQAKEGVGE